MKQYNVQLRVKNGGTQNVFVTTSRKEAACFCKGKNIESEKLNSPNRYFFEETEC